MPHSSHSFTTEEAKQIIEKDNPDIRVEFITLLDDGWDNAAFDVNGEYIFRFPKGKEAHFEVELNLLQALKGKITVPIPDIQFLGKEVSYMGYKKLQGVSLTPELYYQMTDHQKDKLAADYAQFAFDIHNALTVKQAEEVGIKAEDSFKNVPVIESMLVPSKITDPNILAFAKDTVREYTDTVNENGMPSFIYGDLHTENIAFDPVAKKLNGIFDFGDACIADIHFEFAPIYKFSTELLESAVHKYEFLANTRLSLRKIVLRGRMNELGDLAEYIDQPNSEIYQKAMRRMAKWIKEKDIYKDELQVAMSAEDVADFYTSLENIGIKIWIDGGWCVDALLGKQLRPHKDLDIAMQWKDVPKLREFLAAKGYKQIKEDSKWNFVLRDATGREIDVHAFVYDDKGNVVDGVMYPAESLTGTGTINDVSVNCISAKYMVEFLAPWIHKYPNKYLVAVATLCEKFGIKLPAEYIKFTKG